MIETRTTKRRREAMAITTVSSFPEDLIINILSRLPVKSIFRFKCVSKSCLALVESPAFVAEHLHHSSRNPYLLIRYYNRLTGFNAGLALLRADGTVHNVEIPFLEGLTFPKIVGSCNGLLCLDVSSCFGNNFVLWNIATNNFERLPKPAPSPTYKKFWMFSLGFGHNRHTNDYILLRIVNFENLENGTVHKIEEHRYELRVEVYKSSTGCWNQIVSNTASLCLIHGGQEAVAVGEVLHWMANGYGVLANRKFIFSFDMNREIFRRTIMPEFPPENYVKAISYNESLALAVYPGFRSEGSRLELWVMNEKNNWTKQQSIGMIPRFACPIGSWNDSDIIIKMEDELLLLNPKTRQSVQLSVGRILGYKCSYNVFTHVDSLVSGKGGIQAKAEIEGRNSLTW